MKKLISILLCLFMLLSMFPVCLTAQAEEEIPTIYLCGYGCILQDAEGHWIYPLSYPDNPGKTIDWLDYLGLSEGVDIGALVARVKDSIAGNEDALTDEEEDSIFVQLLVSFLTDSREEYTRKFCENIGPVYEKFILTKDGEKVDGSKGFSWFDDGIYCECDENGGEIMQIHEAEYPCMDDDVLKVEKMELYDWRLSPMVLAEAVHNYIVSRGYTRINLVGRCLGCCVALAYLGMYGNDSNIKIEKAMFYMPSFTGINALTALFSGDIQFDSGAVTDFVTFMNNNGTLSLGDESTDNLLKAILGLADSTATMPLGLDVLKLFLSDTLSTLLPAFLKISYATLPSFWSMVAPEKYEQAKAFIFSDCTEEEKAEWAGLLAKTDAFYEIQKNYKTILKDMEASGTEIAVIAKYGIPCVPVSSDAHLEGDLLQTTNLQSLGATVTNIDEKFSDEYIENGQYVSADGKIDASTCLFPDTTWFIKNCTHKRYAPCFTSLIAEYLKTDGMTVNTNPEYTQYLNYTHISGEEQYSVGTIAPIVKAEDTDDATQTYDKSPLTKVKQLFISLITKFINWVIGIFAGIK